MSREERLRQGICVDCNQPATHGQRCFADARANAERSRTRKKRLLGGLGTDE